jgi:WD40 repeat protein
VVIFGGQEGEKVGELVDESCEKAAHAGGVFALAWNSDGKKLVTASGDKTLKVWDVPVRKLIG